MRKAERQAQLLALGHGTVADAHELELLLVALRHALHQVREVRAQRAGMHQRLLVALRDLDADVIAFLHQAQARTQRQRERALGALDGDGAAVDRVGYALGQRNRPFCNS
jgi:hypothetical protein